MKFRYIQNTVDLYTAALLASYGAPQGCSEEEIHCVEAHFCHPFPLAFREYLLWMGNDVNGIFRGTDFFLKDIMDNMEALVDVISANNIKYQITDDLIVFFSHQGYIVAWFSSLSTEEDPRVFIYSEGNDMKEPCNNERFSEFLFREVSTILKHHDRKAKKLTNP